MRIFNMVGIKLIKQKEDGELHTVRIINVPKPQKITKNTPNPGEIKIYDYDLEKMVKVTPDSLKEYSPLEPDGIVTFNVVKLKDATGNDVKDVLVTGTKFLNIKLFEDASPYVICRQSITDFFYNLLCNDESEQIVGISVNQDTCPANLEFNALLAADQVLYNDFINIYRTDVLDDIMSMVSESKYNDVLRSLFNKHIKHIKRPDLAFLNEHGGWCKDIRTLLNNNNFQVDLNQMLGITQVEFDLKDYMINKELPGRKDEFYSVADETLSLWLSYTFKLPKIKEASILLYDHDINLGDFNEHKYFLIRDNNDDLYLVVYTTDNEEFKFDLEAKAAELNFTEKLRLKYYNKYNTI